MKHYSLRRVRWEDFQQYAHLNFACDIQDVETLEAVQDLLDDYDITGVLVGTETGDYDPILVRFGHPSYRNSEDDWYLVGPGKSYVDYIRIIDPREGHILDTTFQITIEVQRNVGRTRTYRFTPARLGRISKIVERYNSKEKRVYEYNFRR